ncbi:putative LPS assembly protein LptD [Candidatus Pelagibacter sp. Uisw_114]
MNVILHKTMFGDDDNDPRINSVSVSGDESNTYFNKGVFTSCKKTDKCPPWKITSNKIHHDKIKKQIVYKNAWLEIYDFPVVYFPKFFHPDPTVERQSGFLRPEMSNSNTLGSSVYTPYFFVISDNKDLTIKPRLFDSDRYLLQSEYRQKTKNSFTLLDFSFLNGDRSALKIGVVQDHTYFSIH